MTDTHVFVETNYLVELLRPRANPFAKALHDHHGRDLALHIPWCCRGEALRTLMRIIEEDLGFDRSVVRFALREYQDSLATEMPPVQRLVARARERKAEALTSLSQRIEEACAHLSMIAPSAAVVNRTLSIFRQKHLKPFDEMVVGAVLAKAAELRAGSHCALHFATLDRDLRTANMLPLYAQERITLHDDFRAVLELSNVAGEAS